MRSKKVEISLPWDLYEAVRKEAHLRGINSLSRYFIAIALEQIIHTRRVEVTNQTANASPDEQDEIIAYLLSVPLDKPSLLRWIRLTKPLKKMKIFSLMLTALLGIGCAGIERTNAARQSTPQLLLRHSQVERELATFRFGQRAERTIDLLEAERDAIERELLSRCEHGDKQACAAHPGS